MENQNKVPSADELYAALQRKLHRASAASQKKKLESGEFIEVDGSVRPNPNHENYYKYVPEPIESIISDADLELLFAGNAIKVLTEDGNYITISATKE